MSIEANKKLVLSYFENFSAGKVDAFLAHMTDTATWWIAGKPGSHGIAGTKTKAEFGELFRGSGAFLRNGLRITPKVLTAEDDRVAVEAESYGETVSGKIYNNEYHFLITVRDGKIQEVKEYMDTLHVKEVLLGQ